MDILNTLTTLIENDLLDKQTAEQLSLLFQKEEADNMVDDWKNDQTDVIAEELKTNPMAKQMLVDSVNKAGLKAEDLAPHIIEAESGGRANAVSPAGAQGIMQLMPSTGKELAQEQGISYDPFDREQNQKLGTLYYQKMLDKYNNDPAFALAAYNAGPGNVDNALDKAIAKYQNPYPSFEQMAEFLPKKEETIPYVRKVLGSYSASQDLNDIPEINSNNIRMLIPQNEGILTQVAYKNPQQEGQLPVVLNKEINKEMADATLARQTNDGMSVSQLVEERKRNGATASVNDLPANYDKQQIDTLLDQETAQIMQNAFAAAQEGNTDATQEITNRSIKMQQEALANKALSEVQQNDLMAKAFEASSAKLNEIATENAKRRQEYQNSLDEHFKKQEEFVNKYNNPEIDPDRVFKNMGTWDYILAAITLGLSATSPQNISNALGRIQQSVNNDIKAQIEDIEGNKEKADLEKNLISSAIQITNNINASEAQARASQLEYTKAQIDTFAKQLNSQTAIANAQQLTAQLQQEIDKNKANSMQTYKIELDSKFSDAENQQLEQKRYDEMYNSLPSKVQEKAIPGVGIVRDNKDSKEIKEGYNAYQEILSDLNTIKEAYTRSGVAPIESLSSDRAKAKAAAANITNNLRAATKAGTLDKGAIELFQKYIPQDPLAPGAWFDQGIVTSSARQMQKQLSSDNKDSLETQISELENRIKRSFFNNLQTNMYMVDPRLKKQYIDFMSKQEISSFKKQNLGKVY